MEDDIKLQGWIAQIHLPVGWQKLKQLCVKDLLDLATQREHKPKTRKIRQARWNLPDQNTGISNVQARCERNR